MNDSKSTPRPLTAHEVSAIEKLVDACPPEFRAVKDQLKDALVTGQCACGCATIDISTAHGSPAAAGEFTGLLPAEGSILRGSDPADTLIAFLRDGQLVGLEVYGVADTPTYQLPPATDIIVLPATDAGWR